MPTPIEVFLLFSFLDSFLLAREDFFKLKVSSEILFSYVGAVSAILILSNKLSLEKLFLAMLLAKVLLVLLTKHIRLGDGDVVFLYSFLIGEIILMGIVPTLLSVLSIVALYFAFLTRQKAFLEENVKFPFFIVLVLHAFALYLLSEIPLLT